MDPAVNQARLGWSRSMERATLVGSAFVAGAASACVLKWCFGAHGGSALTYQEWIEQYQQSRTEAHEERLSRAGEGITALPPFDHDSLFHPIVEGYAMAETTPASADVQRIVDSTQEMKLFAPCMVGQLEGQFLKMMAQIFEAKRVLDVGTFTGYSALSFAEGMPADGKVVTIEFDEKVANVAKNLFDASQQRSKIKLCVGDALKHMRQLAEKGETFDIIFLDADKENYVAYYKLAMEGKLLTKKRGIILADNSLCSLVYGQGDFRRQKLHEFNEFVRKDKSVEQVVLTVREGITIIRPNW